MRTVCNAATLAATFLALVTPAQANDPVANWFQRGGVAGNIPVPRGLMPPGVLKPGEDLWYPKMPPFGQPIPGTTPGTSTQQIPGMGMTMGQLDSNIAGGQALIDLNNAVAMGQISIYDAMRIMNYGAAPTQKAPDAPPPRLGVQLTDTPQGVLVVSVNQGSIAEALRLLPGDLLVQIGGVRVTSAAHAAMLVKGGF